MKSVDPEVFRVGIDRRELDAPIGLVFPEPDKLDAGHIEGAAAPIGGGGHATTDQQTGGEGGEGEEGSAESEALGKTVGHGIKVQSPRPQLQARLWWCNADFDLTLAHGGGKVPAKILEAARGMSWPLWPALAPGDALLVPAPPPAGYVEYLTEQGLTPPHFRTDPAGAVYANETPPAASVVDLKNPDTSDYTFTPFGWNAEAANRNAVRKNPASHPDPEVVRRVNSRAFSMELESALFGEAACPARFCDSRAAIEPWIATARPGRYVAKGNHGHAGIGQLRFAVDAAHAAPEKALQRLRERHGGIVIEEAHQIEREWGVLFRVGPESGPAVFSKALPKAFRVHRLLSDASGGYTGALGGPAVVEDPVWIRIRSEVAAGVQKISDALSREGYFGPAGIDVYTHRRAHGETQLRVLVDLNARMTMAWPLHGLIARVPHQTVLLWQVPTSEIQLPSGYDSLKTFSDKLSFGSEANRRLIWVTPLLPLTRHTLAFIGAHEGDVMDMQAKFPLKHSR
jgi:hypothetical protein